MIETIMVDVFVKECILKATDIPGPEKWKFFKTVSLQRQ
jgi:hypothetical protein